VARQGQRRRPLKGERQEDSGKAKKGLTKDARRKE
jgi:hypothetical protein